MLSSIYKTLGAWGQCYKTFSVSDLQIFLLSKSVCLTRPEKLSNDNHSSLLQKSLIYVKKSFKHFALHYKTFHCSIISCVIISQSVCHCYTIPCYSNICGLTIHIQAPLWQAPAMSTNIGQGESDWQWQILQVIMIWTFKVQTPNILFLLLNKIRKLMIPSI